MVPPKGWMRLLHMVQFLFSNTDVLKHFDLWSNLDGDGWVGISSFFVLWFWETLLVKGQRTFLIFPCCSISPKPCFFFSIYVKHTIKEKFMPLSSMNNEYYVSNFVQIFFSFLWSHISHEKKLIFTKFKGQNCFLLFFSSN